MMRWYQTLQNSTVSLHCAAHFPAGENPLKTKSGWRSSRRRRNPVNEARKSTTKQLSTTTPLLGCRHWYRAFSMSSSHTRSPTGLRSPLPLRSTAASSRSAVKFDSESLRVYMKKLLLTTFQDNVWPDIKDQNDRVKAWNKEIGERVKERMLEIQPHG